jgi:hypothetical protein
LRHVAHDPEAGGAAVDRFDRQSVLGEQQGVSADTAAEIERRADAAATIGCGKTL